MLTLSEPLLDQLICEFAISTALTLRLQEIISRTESKVDVDALTLAEGLLDSTLGLITARFFVHENPELEGDPEAGDKIAAEVNVLAERIEDRAFEMAKELMLLGPDEFTVVIEWNAAVRDQLLPRVA